MSELKSKEFIFLTRNEVQISTSYQLTIHLRHDDPRTKKIMNSYKESNLSLVIVDPMVKWVGTFMPGKFYYFPNIFYTGRVKTRTHWHFSFNWRYKYRNDFGKVKQLTDEQIEFFRNNNYINAD
jgi:hypothetical protein